MCTRLATRARLDRSPPCINRASSALSPPCYHSAVSFAALCAIARALLSFSLPAQKQIAPPFEFMSSPLFTEGGLSLASPSPKDARGALVDADVVSREKRTALVALLAISWARAVVKRAGTYNLTVVIWTTDDRPYLAPFYEFWHAELTCLEGGGGLRLRGGLVRARIFASLPLAKWKNLCSEFEDMLIFTPGNLKIEMLRELWKAAHAFSEGPDQSVDIRPFSRARPILGAFSTAAELKGDAAEASNLGAHRRREDQKLSLDGAQASQEGPSKRMGNPIEDAKHPPEIREYMDLGGRLNIPRMTDRSLVCVSSGLKRWGLFCDLNMLPRSLPRELAVLRWNFFFPRIWN